MSSVYCSQCGSKHQAGAKFCSSCGSGLSALSRQNTPQNVNRPSQVQEDPVETFRRPNGLAYEIGNNVYKAEEVFNANPVDEGNKIKRPAGVNKTMSKEELLSESLRECAPVRKTLDINET